MTHLTGHELGLLAKLIGGSHANAWGKATKIGETLEARDLRIATAEQFMLAGLTRVEADRVAAGIELGRKAEFFRVLVGGRIACADDAVAVFRAEVGFPEKEVFAELLLNGRHHVIRFERIAEGCLTAALVHPREVLRPAIQHGAAAILIMHNHPSGDASPSPEDLALTRQLCAAARTCAIDLLDHIVIGEDSHTSFAADGLFPTAKEIALPKACS